MMAKITKTFSVDTDIFEKFEKVSKKKNLNKSSFMENKIREFVNESIEVDTQNDYYYIHKGEDSEYIRIISKDLDDNKELFVILSDGNRIKFEDFEKICCKGVPRINPEEFFKYDKSILGKTFSEMEKEKIIEKFIENVDNDKSDIPEDFLEKPCINPSIAQLFKFIDTSKLVDNEYSWISEKFGMFLKKDEIETKSIIVDNKIAQVKLHYKIVKEDYSKLSHDLWIKSHDLWTKEGDIEVEVYYKDKELKYDIFSTVNYPLNITIKMNTRDTGSYFDLEIQNKNYKENHFEIEIEGYYNKIDESKKPYIKFLFNPGDILTRNNLDKWDWNNYNKQLSGYLELSGYEIPTVNNYSSDLLNTSSKIEILETHINFEGIGIYKVQSKERIPGNPLGLIEVSYNNDSFRKEYIMNFIIEENFTYDPNLSQYSFVFKVISNEIESYIRQEYLNVLLPKVDFVGYSRIDNLAIFSCGDSNLAKEIMIKYAERYTVVQSIDSLIENEDEISLFSTKDLDSNLHFYAEVTPFVFKVESGKELELLKEIKNPESIYYKSVEFIKYSVEDEKAVFTCIDPHLVEQLNQDYVSLSYKEVNEEFPEDKDNEITFYDKILGRKGQKSALMDHYIEKCQENPQKAFGPSEEEKPKELNSNDDPKIIKKIEIPQIIKKWNIIMKDTFKVRDIDRIKDMSIYAESIYRLNNEKYNIILSCELRVLAEINKYLKINIMPYSDNLDISDFKTFDIVVKKNKSLNNDYLLEAETALVNEISHYINTNKEIKPNCNPTELNIYKLIETIDQSETEDYFMSKAVTKFIIK